MKVLLLSVLVFVLPFYAGMAQTTLEGTVTNTDGEALPNINILIYPAGSNVLIAFAVSNNTGGFQALVRSASDSLDIETSSIHYRNERRTIANVSQNLQFELVTEVTQLETFTIKAPAIEQRGDTISYLVSSFASEEDRAIRDVLRRMPGIEVEPGGRILYQGSPIQKFYVEGLDLMGGRYGLISNNMPHRSVAAVEILENHQPIRILEERVPSERASLNLRLKRDITTTGTAKLGSGLEPWLWDANITPMMFTRKFQMAASYQANNAGNDVSKQLRTLTLRSLQRQMDGPRDNPNILDIQTMSPPDFSENRYLDNNIHLGNANALTRLNNDFQLRANLFYINDTQQQKGNVFRTLYTPADTLLFTETLENEIKNNYLQGEFTLTRNVKDNYLENKLMFQSHWDKRSGVLDSNEELIGQSLDHPFRSVSNELRSVNPVGDYLVEFISHVSWDRSPQSLRVSPGRFEELLHQGESYDQTLQEVRMQRFFANHSAGFSFGWRRLSFSPRVGFAYRTLDLDSGIYTGDGDHNIAVEGPFANSLRGRHTRTYLQTGVTYRYGDLTVTTDLPLSLHRLDLQDEALDQGQDINRLHFDSRLSINYQISGFWRVRGSYRFSNSLGNMDDMHYGFLMKNYRSIQQNAAPIRETTNHIASVSLNHRNPITAFFNTLSYTYSINNFNLIYSSQVLDNGSTIREAFEMPNTGYMHGVSGRTSKFFSDLHSTFTLRGTYSLNERMSLVNGELFESRNRMFNASPQVNTRITQWLRTEYRANLTYIQTHMHGGRKNNISMLRHFLDIHAFYTGGHYIGLSTEYYRHENSEHYFMDLLYRFSIRRHNLDVEARWLNIFNTDSYITWQTGAYSLVETTYLLRPSQLFLSVRFSF